MVFPENEGAAGSFSEIRYGTALCLDRITSIPQHRPCLGQISLPVAIRRAGPGWHELPEEQYYILGGKLRNQPLPEGREIFTVRCRDHKFLREADLFGTGQQMLRRHTGVSCLRDLVPGPDPGKG